MSLYNNYMFGADLAYKVSSLTRVACIGCKYSAAILATCTQAAAMDNAAMRNPEVTLCCKTLHCLVRCYATLYDISLRCKPLRYVVRCYIHNVVRRFTTL